MQVIKLLTLGLIEDSKMTGVPCGCGRSKTGFCDGSHGLSPESWAKIQEDIELDKFLNEKTEDKKQRKRNEMVR